MYLRSAIWSVVLMGALTGCTSETSMDDVATKSQAQRVSLVDFDASRGFVFKNDFRNLANAGSINFTTAGQCGGMSYAILDYYFNGLTPPQQPYRPAEGSVLQEYIFMRQDSSVFGAPLDNWTDVLFNPFDTRDDELFGRSLDGRPGGQLRRLVERIDGGFPVPLGYVSIQGPLSGHQVIAYGYDLHGASLSDFDGSYRGPVSLFVLDPNYPKTEMELVHDGDQVWYYANWESVAFGTLTRNQVGEYLTFFADLDYSPQQPPAVDEPVYPNDGMIYEVILTLQTGKDDLTGGGGHVNATLNMQDGTTVEFENVNLGRRWISNYDQSVRLRLSAPIQEDALQSVTIDDTFGGGTSGDNWDLKWMNVQAVMGGSAGNRLVELSQNVGTYAAYPHEEDQLFRFKGDDAALTVLTNDPATMTPGIVTGLLLTFDTGSDNLEGGGNDNVHVTVQLKDGSSKETRNINRGVNWGNDSQHQTMFHLDDPIPVCQLDSLIVSTEFAGGSFSDNWNMDALAVEARGHATTQLVGSHGAIRFTGDLRETTVNLSGSDGSPPAFEGLPLPVAQFEMCPNDPPVPARLNVPRAVDECGPATVTGAITSSSSMVVPTPIAADGRFTLSYGYHAATWTASDGTQNVTTTQLVQGLDTTSPTFLPYPAEVTLSTCQPSGGAVALTVPEAEDNCGTVMVSGVLTRTDGTSSPIAVTSDGIADVGVGVYTVTWTAVDTNFQTATATQVVRVAPALQVSDAFTMRSNTSIRLGEVSGALGGIANSGAGTVELGPDAAFGEVLSVGPVRVGDRSIASGRIRSSNWISLGNDLELTGPIQPYSLVAINDLPVPVVEVPGTSLGTLQQNAEAPPLHLAPGSYYERVGIHRATGIILTAGVYYFDRLEFLETGGYLEVDQSAGPVTIVILEHFGQRGELRFTGGEARDFTLIYLGSQDVTIETSFIGSFFAPFARATLGSGAGQDFVGRFYARAIELRDNSTIVCEANDCVGMDCYSMPEPGYACTDGAWNGLETDVDCGGPNCGPCDPGQSCQVDRRK